MLSAIFFGSVDLQRVIRKRQKIQSYTKFSNSFKSFINQLQFRYSLNNKTETSRNKLETDTATFTINNQFRAPNKPKMNIEFPSGENRSDKLTIATQTQK